MKEYGKEELQKIQELELGILRDFVDVCEKEGFRYYVDMGSLIGAVRHSGFIPWDDDIDVAMPRKDYMLFLEYAKKYMSEKYNVLNVYEYDNYPITTTQLALRGTKFVVEPFKDIKDIPFGVYLDIFPMDFISDDDRIMKRQIRKSFFWGKLMILTSVKKPYLPYKGLKADVIYLVTYCIHWILSLFKISSGQINKKLESFVKEDISGTKRIKYMNASLQYDVSMKWDDVFPTVPLKFCDIIVQAPKEYDKYLRELYGDYMKLPPVEKRKSHSPTILDLGIYS